MKVSATPKDRTVTCGLQGQKLSHHSPIKKTTKSQRLQYTNYKTPEEVESFCYFSVKSGSKIPFLQQHVRFGLPLKIKSFVFFFVFFFT